MKGLALALGGLFALACHAPSTELVLVVRSELRVPDMLDAVRIEVDGRALGEPEVTVREVSLVGPGSFSLPLTLVVLHEGEDTPLGPVGVRAVGLRQGSAQVERETQTRFVRGRSIAVFLDLGAEVSPAEDAGTPRDLDAGVPLEPDASAPARDAGASSAVDGGPPAGTDAGRLVSDAGAPPRDGGRTVDAGPVCPTRVVRCRDGCGCEDGCRCDLECRRGELCADGWCAEVGTVCDVEADDSRLFSHRCTSGATCTIDIRSETSVGEVLCLGNATCVVACRDVERCPVRCEDGAQCLLRCEDADGCRFVTCDGTLERCDADGADDLYACNRPCP